VIELEPGDAFLLYTDGLFRWTKDERHRVTPGQLEKNFWIIPRPTAEALLKRVVGANSFQEFCEDCSR